MDSQSITLKANQAALILEVDEDGAIDINVAALEEEGLASALCQAIAYKIVHDEQFQAELMDMLDFEDD